MLFTFLFSLICFSLRFPLWLLHYLEVCHLVFKHLGISQISFYYLFPGKFYYGPRIYFVWFCTFVKPKAYWISQYVLFILVKVHVYLKTMYILLLWGRVFSDKFIRPSWFSFWGFTYLRVLINVLILLPPCSIIYWEVSNCSCGCVYFSLLC